MVKPGSQRQKEYLKRLKEKKTGENLRKKQKESRKSWCYWKPQTSSITMRKYEKTKTEKNYKEW